MSASRLPEKLVAWMDSLADRTRLRLMRVLERHELGVVELCEILQLPQSTVSRHLKILSDRGWVRPRREGTTRLYRAHLDELDSAARKLWMLAREQTDDWTTIQQDDLRLVRRLRNREADSQAFFAGAAGKWDKLRQIQYGESFTHSAMLSLLPGDFIVADLGCGTGQVAAMLSEHVRKVIAVDSSAAMLKAARKRLNGRVNIELLRAELTETPLETNSCDAALLLLVLSYVANYQDALREASRILKPGGKLVIIDLMSHDRDDFRRQMEQVHAGFDINEMSSALLNAGLKPGHVAPLPPEPAAKGPAMFLATSIKVN
jgi:ArsR family transcriptional regulator